MEEAAYLCDRILILDRGKVLADGSLSQLLSTFASGEVILLKINKYIQEEVLCQVNGVQEIVWVQDGLSAVLTVNSITQTLPQLMELLQKKDIEIKSLECRKKTLDDLFVAMTGRRLDE